MMVYALGAAATGVVMLSRLSCALSRLIGACLLAAALLVLSSPASADETILAADSSQVRCTVSAKDLTRISLVEDEFASVSKLQTGDAGDDFSVVNEPVRGDIYLTVPEGYSRQALSFFATSKRGYVYKFLCRIAGDEAAQVFVSNPAIAKEKAVEDAGPATETAEDAAIELIRAMFAGGVLDGYEMRQKALRPVGVGDLKVRMVAEYVGAELTGRTLRIENTGAAEMILDEKLVASGRALAVSIAQPVLGPGKTTTAYIVSRTGS